MLSKAVPIVPHYNLNKIRSNMSKYATIQQVKMVHNLSTSVMPPTLDQYRSDRRA